MKKKIIVLILLILIVIVAVIGFFYFKDTENQTNDLEKKVATASSDYFEKYVSANDSANSYKVTLKDLEEANQNGEEYDLKGLEKCDKTKTFANVTLDYQTGKAKKTQVELNC